MRLHPHRTCAPQGVGAVDLHDLPATGTHSRLAHPGDVEPVTPLGGGGGLDIGSSAPSSSGHPGSSRGTARPDSDTPPGGHPHRENRSHPDTGCPLPAKKSAIDRGAGLNALAVYP